MYITQSKIFIFYYTTLLVVTFPNAEMTLGLEVNEVEAKVLTSLASVTGSTGFADIGLTESNVREPGLRLPTKKAAVLRWTTPKEEHYLEILVDTMK